MTKYKNDGDMYLQMYPKLSRWMNECIVCHAKGYKPEMPEHIGGKYSIASNNLKKYFKPLAVSELSICEQCAKFTECIE